MTSKSRALSGLSAILSDLENRTPAGTAEKWDNVGLLVGDANSSAKVKGAVVSIDLTAETIASAKRLGFSLVINHHPAIFPKSRGIPRVTAGGSTGLIYEAARAGISVASRTE